jgi:hypothetical protein
MANLFAMPNHGNSIGGGLLRESIARDNREHGHGRNNELVHRCSLLLQFVETAYHKWIWDARVVLSSELHCCGPLLKLFPAIATLCTVIARTLPCFWVMFGAFWLILRILNLDVQNGCSAKHQR